MNALIPKDNPKVVSKITDHCPAISDVHSTSVTNSTNYLAEGFGILFFPASLNDEALTCLE